MDYRRKSCKTQTPSEEQYEESQQTKELSIRTLVEFEAIANIKYTPTSSLIDTNPYTEGMFTSVPFNITCLAKREKAILKEKTKLKTKQTYNIY
jgi:hypothetical protein